MSRPDRLAELPAEPAFQDELVRAGVRDIDLQITALPIQPPLGEVQALVTVHHVPTGVSCTYEVGEDGWVPAFTRDLQSGRYQPGQGRAPAPRQPQPPRS